MWTVFACAQIDELQVDGETAKVEMTFTATITNENDTKTTLEGNLEDGVLQTLWIPTDVIGIGTATAGAMNTKFEKFLNIQTENSQTGLFQGTISQADSYNAIYPYAGNGYKWVNGEHLFTINLPKTQKYVEGTFASGAAPMIASASAGGVFEFQNLCGILALRLQGEGSIKSITFCGNNANGEALPVSGGFVVKTSDPLNMLKGDDYPDVSTNTSTSVSLICDNPVQLSTSEPTPFYFVLPPATYSTFTILITTSDGKVMMKEGKNPLTVERAHAKPTAALEYAENVIVDLSADGIANSYIVTGAGVYSFNADIIGNGNIGITDAENFHTADASISPVSADLLWCDNAGAIVSASYDAANKRVIIAATEQKGNALIAVRDQSDNILWSWHIWATDKPESHEFTNSYGTFCVMDRNLGATKAEPSSEAAGLLYQWGRKDPFRTTGYQIVNGFNNIQESVRSPLSFGTGDVNWFSQEISSLWSDSKTIYDPCPAGWKVASDFIWANYVKLEDIDGSAGGLYIKYSDNDTSRAWYQDTQRINSTGGVEGSLGDDDTEFWNTSFGVTRYIKYNGTSSWSRSKSDGCSVRCIRDDEHHVIYTEISEITDISSVSATASGKVEQYGNTHITEAGFVIGSTPSVTLENGTKYTADIVDSIISTEISGLQEYRKYYIRTFVRYTEGTIYSAPVSFITPNSEGVVNLSLNGSANTYIVYPVAGTYTFDTVKGNSSESVGTVSSAEVLWETYNSSTEVIQNSVIASAELYGDKVRLTMPDEPVPGNAVIAVRDDFGTILWSWHIWVADFDPEATKQTYISGAVMMDRNLGALAIADNDPRTNGLIYQWGRKDPFIAPLDSWSFASTFPSGLTGAATDVSDYNYSIQNPTITLYSIEWNNDPNLWTTDKTIYDPCPAGWRVPDSNAWSGIPTWEYGSWGSDGNLTVIRAPYSEPAAYYYSGGWVGSYRDINEFNNSSMNHSVTIPAEFSSGYMYSSRFSDSFQNEYLLWRDYLLPVRCMKETEMNSGSNEGYTESDDYEW